MPRLRATRRKTGCRIWRELLKRRNKLRKESSCGLHRRARSYLKKSGRRQLKSHNRLCTEGIGHFLKADWQGRSKRLRRIRGTKLKISALKVTGKTKRLSSRASVRSSRSSPTQGATVWNAATLSRSPSSTTVTIAPPRSSPTSKSFKSQ